MPRKRTPLSQNSDFLNQIMDYIIMAISEHRWKDASLLLPSIVALSRRKISPYFIWKILHAVMSSTHIPLAMQIQILQIMQKSSVKNYELILDLFAYKFEVIDEQDFETFYESVNESKRSKDSKDLLRSLCFSYYALHYYLKWKRFLINMQDPSLCEKKQLFQVNEENEKELGKLGFKARALLHKAFSFFQLSDKKDSEEEEHYEKLFPCEWLLGPLLDIDAYTKGKNKFESKKRKEKNDYSGLELIEYYAANHFQHVPALRTFYFYLIEHHSDEKLLILEVLEKIVRLSPDSSLVLQYTLSLLSEESIMIGGSQERSKRKLKGCSLENMNFSTMLKCLKLLTNFIEYRMWRKDVRAWKALKDILIIFHESWISCWECHHCSLSRKQIEEFSDTLSLWSHFIWHENQLELFTLEDAELLVYVGYTSFVLGYSERIARKAIECLQNLECKYEAANLLNLMKQKGNHERDFLIYLLHQRKRRNVAKDNTAINSGSYSVRKTEVKFSSFKTSRKNYFVTANQSCLTTEEVREITLNNVVGCSKGGAPFEENDEIEDGSCDSNYTKTPIVPDTVTKKSGSKLGFGRKYKTSKNKNAIENSINQNNGNLSEVKDCNNEAGTSSEIIQNQESIFGNEKKESLGCNKTLKRKSQIGPSLDSSAVNESKFSLESNKVSFGRKRKLSNEILQENKKRRI